jgi:membrane-associated protease RseP (regulator of RpoE activity)
MLLPGETNMQRRVGVYFATTVLIISLLTACRTRTAPQENKLDENKEADKQAAINAVLAHEQACQTYDFVKLDFLYTPDAREIEESYPHPPEPELRQFYQSMKDAGVRIDYRPQDAVAEVRGDVAWVTLTLHSVWTADTPAARAILGGSVWHATFAESFILVKTPEGWKITFVHASMLPPNFGVEPDYQQEHGGMKLVKVPEDGPAGKAGLKSGDVLIEYGGRKIDNYIDYSRLVHAYSEGEKVTVTVMRGHEKITKEVTLEAMR